MQVEVLLHVLPLDGMLVHHRVQGGGNPRVKGAGSLQEARDERVGEIGIVLAILHDSILH